MSQLPYVAELPTVSLTSLTQLPAVGTCPLPTVPNILGNNIFLPGLPLGNFIPAYLADNETAGLNWRRGNPPIPFAAIGAEESQYRRIGCIGDGHCFFHAVSKGMSALYRATYIVASQVREETLQVFENALGERIFHPHAFQPPRTLDPTNVYTIINRSRFEADMNTFRTKYVHALRLDFARHILQNERMQQIILNRMAGEIEVNTSIIMANYNTTIEVAQPYAFKALLQELANELNDLSTDADARYILILSDFYNIDIYMLVNEYLIDPASRSEILDTYRHQGILGQPDRPSIVLIHVGGGHFEIVGRVDQPGTINETRITVFDSNEPLVQRLFDILQNARIRELTT